MQCFKKYVRSIAGVLAVLTVFLSVPKEAWHHCDHSHDPHSVSSDGDHDQISASEDCPVCKFQWFPYTYKACSHLTSPPGFTALLKELPIAWIALPVQACLSLRGPPSC